MPGIPANLYRRLREVLRDCKEFQSDQRLQTVFVVNELSPFRDRLPQAEAMDERIARVIDYLVNQFLLDGRAVLPVFLIALSEHYDLDDVQYTKLRTLAAELERQIEKINTQPDTASALPSSASASSPDLGLSALQKARRILEILETQAAGYTALTIPVNLQIELEEQRREVARLEANSSFQSDDNNRSKRPESTLLQKARRELAILEEQAAGYTALTIPANLQVELEEKRKEVERLEAGLSPQAEDSDQFVHSESVLPQKASRDLEILEGQAAAGTTSTIPADLQVELDEKREEVTWLEADLPPQPPGNAPSRRPERVLSWLHLADLQLETDFDLIRMDSLFEDIERQIERLGTRLDFVAVTGDIAFAGQAREYNSASKFLETLLNRLQVDRDCLFIVPGNHDINRKAATLNEQSDLTRYMNASLENFRKFVRTLSIPSPTESSRYPYSYTMKWGDRQVAICYLNTAIADSLQGLTRRQRAYLEKQIAQYSAVEGAINIVLLHHSLTYLADENIATDILEQHSDFILHGHYHQNEASRVIHRDSGAMIIQADSDYNIKENPNCYNLAMLDFNTGQGTILFRRMVGDTWQDDTQNQLPGEYKFLLSQRLRSLWLPESEGFWSPPLAGYVADTTDADDQLSITAEVNAFSAVIASKALQPPLCLGLFGDWGSGKTFFMKKMYRRIEYLAAQSQNAEKLSPPRETTFCSRIVQINFNAWHYTDANLLACLVEQIFESLGKCYSKEIEDRRIEETERHMARLKHEKGQAQQSVETAKIATLQKILTSKYNIPEDVFAQAKSVEDVISNLGGITMQLRMVFLRLGVLLKIFFVFLSIYTTSAILQFLISSVFSGQSSSVQDIEKIINSTVVF